MELQETPPHLIRHTQMIVPDDIGTDDVHVARTENGSGLRLPNGASMAICPVNRD
jgi:hypothetical protein